MHTETCEEKQAARSSQKSLLGNPNKQKMACDMRRRPHSEAA